MKTDDSSVGDEGNLVAANDTIAYDTSTGIFTVESAAFDMDGADKPRQTDWSD